jgi:thiol:disulfide interchange protein DsbC
MRHIFNGVSGVLLTVSVTVSLGVSLGISPAARAADSDFSKVEERIRILAPQAKSIAISETPIEGLLMVQIGGDIVYATADGKYLVQGRVMDMDTLEDLTEGAKAEIRRDLLSTANAGGQITFGPEDAEYDLTVFTDIDCGYCRKLHAQIDAYNQQGIAIHYMAFPRAGIGSHSYDKAVSVWCAGDQRNALTQAKLGAEPDPAKCDNPIEAQYQLGRDLGVTGTPSLLTADGQMIPGYVPPDKLRQRLDQMAATVKAP